MSTRKDVFRDRNGEYLEVWENFQSVSICFGEEEINLNREQVHRLIQDLIDLEKRI